MGLNPWYFSAARAAPGIGLAFLSEILALRFPDKYWMWNGPIRAFFVAQQIDIKNELPYGKKGDPGEEYFLVGKHLEELRRTLAKQLDKPVNFLMTDLFIYWANKQEIPGDPWAQQIAKWVSETEPKRLDVRLKVNKKPVNELKPGWVNLTSRICALFITISDLIGIKTVFTTIVLSPPFMARRSISSCSHSL